VAARTCVCKNPAPRKRCAAVGGRSVSVASRPRVFNRRVTVVCIGCLYFFVTVGASFWVFYNVLVTFYNFLINVCPLLYFGRISIYMKGSY